LSEPNAHGSMTDSNIMNLKDGIALNAVRSPGPFKTFSKRQVVCEQELAIQPFNGVIWASNVANMPRFNAHGARVLVLLRATGSV
jgi:hypothetical protein